MSSQIKYADIEAIPNKQSVPRLSVVGNCQLGIPILKKVIVRVKRPRHLVENIEDSAVAYSFSGLSILLGGADDE